MKQKLFFPIAFFLCLLLSCNGSYKSENNIKDTIVVHDTVLFHPNDTIRFNIPCKVMTFNMGNPGKALLIIWLHGGITVTPQWTSMLDYEDYFRYPKADEYIVETLQKMGEKAVFLLPICHHSEKHPCRSWNDCAIDVKTIIDDYIHSGVVDEKRIYLTGSSDGGRGVWDLVSRFPHYFAAAMPLSIAPGTELNDSTPIYWNTTSVEGDRTTLYEQYKQKNPNTHYQHHPNLPHGEDEIVLSWEKYMTDFLSNKRK